MLIGVFVFLRFAQQKEFCKGTSGQRGFKKGSLYYLLVNQTGGKRKF